MFRIDFSHIAWCLKYFLALLIAIFLITIISGALLLSIDWILTSLGVSSNSSVLITCAIHFLLIVYIMDKLAGDW